mgnify:CR=1 FL=1
MGVYTSNSPMPGYRRVMSFIDGENLVFCYQSLIKQGEIPKQENYFLEDTYVWNKETLYLRQMENIRATYYTYAVGSSNMINDIQNELRNMYFKMDNKSVLPNRLTPCVFKKDKKTRKTKGVDIKMTVDILSNVYQDNLDTVFLVAGDGDYLPLIKEIRRFGKQIYLAFFTTGLNENLLNYVDHYICLDKLYFQNKIPE